MNTCFDFHASICYQIFALLFASCKYDYYMVSEVNLTQFPDMCSLLFLQNGLSKPPKALNLDSASNFPEVWKVWKDNFNIFLQDNESSAKSDLLKPSLLLHCIGQPANDVYKTFTFCRGE